MELNLGGIVRQVVAPVLDTVSLVRTGTIDQIATFLQGNPDQRGAVETALANNGRTGDLSAIVERVGAAVSDVVGSTRQAIGEAGSAVARTADTLGSAARPVDQIVTRAAETVAAPVRIASDVATRIAGPAVEASARPALDTGRALLSEAQRDLPSTVGGRIAIATDQTPVRTGDLITAALREGRLVELVASATKEGWLGTLVTDARATGQLADVALAARSSDGLLAAFAAKGGLSVTELALFARSGLLSEADVKALRAAGVPIHETKDAQPLIAPRDGPAAERFETERLATEGVTIGALPDPALAGFDAGAIRIASRAAFENYGLLGPPGSMVIAADAFEGLVREADGDLALIERRLGLEAGVLGDPDTFIALLDRRELAGLRVSGAPGGVGGWSPGGDRAGGLPAALADFARATTFREVTLGAAD